MGTFTQDLSSSMPMQPPPSSLDPNAMASLKQAQALSGGPLVQARNFAVMTGVNVGISTVLRRIKGKEDVWSSMAAAFGSGAMFSLVSGMGAPNQVSSAISSGAFFAAFTMIQTFLFISCLLGWECLRHLCLLHSTIVIMLYLQLAACRTLSSLF
ncbi:uncharacterized protein LOC110704500 isoform X1 [Chenopodium quinoa]|uniref:uncharacterized protein LOC110704500 isoform X1 n=1 Tax=Chenopodium quinoa TaxID=63459 RepID=UPI000B77715A|nr:uncharacterized protein LOC110704500 isoform X1 [Chenopodium quinoa]